MGNMKIGRVTSIHCLPTSQMIKLMIDFDEHDQVYNQVVETLTQWAAVMIQLRVTYMIIMKLVFTVFKK